VPVSSIAAQALHAAARGVDAQALEFEQAGRIGRAAARRRRSTVCRRATSSRGSKGLGR
jgi:hypothetical protein